MRGGMGEIRTLQARTPAGLKLAVQVGTDETPDMWTYSLRFRNHPQKHLPVVMEEEVRKRGELVLKRPEAPDKKDPERLAQTYLEQIVVNREFRELAEFLKSIRYLHIVPHLVRDPERSIGKHDDPFGGDFLEKVASTPSKTRDARSPRTPRHYWPTRASVSTRFTSSIPTPRERRSKWAEATRTCAPWSKKAGCPLEPPSCPRRPRRAPISSSEHAVVELARESSKRVIREGLVPSEAGGRRSGPAYTDEPAGATPTRGRQQPSCRIRSARQGCQAGIHILRGWLGTRTDLSGDQSPS